MLKSLIDSATFSLPGSRLSIPGGPGGQRFILSGWAYARCETPDGRSQFLGLLIAGDCTGPAAGAACAGPLTVVALTAVRTIDARPFAQAAPDPARLPGAVAATDQAASLWGRLMLGQLARTRLCAATARFAHLLLELHERLDAVGLIDSQAMALPLTRDRVAEAAGLDCAQLDRAVDRLRRQGAIAVRGGKVALLKRDLLEEACGAERRSFAPADATAPGDDGPRH